MMEKKKSAVNPEAGPTSYQTAVFLFVLVNIVGSNKQSMRSHSRKNGLGPGHGCNSQEPFVNE